MIIVESVEGSRNFIPLTYCIRMNENEFTEPIQVVNNFKEDKACISILQSTRT